VYCPLAHWIFYPGGWLAQWGVLDFAGGLVVETASGVSAFVLAYWLGPGKAAAAEAPHAHNVSLTLIGSGLLLVGWFGFNGGSALAAGYLAGRAMTNTHLAACSAAVVWSLCETIAPPAGGSSSCCWREIDVASSGVGGRKLASSSLAAASVSSASAPAPAWRGCCSGTGASGSRAPTRSTCALMAPKPRRCI
jgi:hypothetical protein